jgi:hypothetical protein
MTMPNDFYVGTNWQQSSGPIVTVEVQEGDCWPIANNSETGTKDTLADGKHPVIAIGGRTAADGRPLNVTGVVVSYSGTDDSGTSTDRVVVNIADGMIVRQWVSNILTYTGTSPATFETTPIVGQPVYVDDSAALSEGVTLSMSPLQGVAQSALRNPLAGYLWYCQNEIADGIAAGARHTATFDGSLPYSETEQEYCVLLINGARDLA